VRARRTLPRGPADCRAAPRRKEQDLRYCRGASASSPRRREQRAARGVRGLPRGRRRSSRHGAGSSRCLRRAASKFPCVIAPEGSACPPILFCAFAFSSHALSSDGQWTRMQQQGEKQGLEVTNVLVRKTTTICPRLVGREAPPSGSGSRYVKERCTCLSNVIADCLMCHARWRDTAGVIGRIGRRAPL
jgi:hypothetical protein